jgi:hypothetical protein
VLGGIFIASLASDRIVTALEKKGNRNLSPFTEGASSDEKLFSSDRTASAEWMTLTPGLTAHARTRAAAGNAKQTGYTEAKVRVEGVLLETVSSVGIAVPLLLD